MSNRERERKRERERERERKRESYIRKRINIIEQRVQSKEIRLLLYWRKKYPIRGGTGCERKEMSARRQTPR